MANDTMLEVVTRDSLHTTGTVASAAGTVGGTPSAYCSLHLALRAKNLGSGTNLPPTADAGSDQIVNQGATVNLTGVATDPESGAMTYLWTIDDATVTITNPTTLTPSFTAPTSTGVRTVTFRVTDDIGQVTTDTCLITVNPPSQEATGESAVIFRRQSGLWVPLTADANTISPARQVQPAATVAYTFDRNHATSAQATLMGNVRAHLVGLTKGMVLTTAKMISGTTAGASLTNFWQCLLDTNLNVLAVTANDTSATWAADTVRSQAFTAPYTVTVSGAYYLAFMLAGTTSPTFPAIAYPAAVESLRNVSPVLFDVLATGQTTPPAVGSVPSGWAFADTTNQNHFYQWVT